MTLFKYTAPCLSPKQQRHLPPKTLTHTHTQTKDAVIINRTLCLFCKCPSSIWGFLTFICELPPSNRLRWRKRLWISKFPLTKLLMLNSRGCCDVCGYIWVNQLSIKCSEAAGWWGWGGLSTKKSMHMCWYRTI